MDDETRFGIAPTSAPRDKGVPNGFVSDPFADPDSDETVVYARELISHPLTHPVEGAISRHDAIDIATNGGLRADPGQVTATLRCVSAGFEGQDASFDPHPAWVVTWLGGKVRLRGGRASAEKMRRRAEAAAKLKRIDVIVINACTGHPEGGYWQFCRSRDDL